MFINIIIILVIVIAVRLVINWLEAKFIKPNTTGRKLSSSWNDFDDWNKY